MGTNFNNLAANVNLNQANPVNLPALNTAPLSPVNLPNVSNLPQNTEAPKAGENLKELKKDTLIIGGKEIKKKTAIMAGIAALLTIGGIAAGIIYAVRKRRLPGNIGGGDSILTPPIKGKPRVPDNAVILDSMPSEIAPLDKVARKTIAEAEGTVQAANKAKREAETLSEDVKRIVREVQELFDTNASQTQDGRKVKIMTTKKGETIIKEFASDNKRVARTSVFRSGKPEIDITEPVSRAKRNIIKVNKKNDIITYMGGFESLKDGTKRYDCKIDLYRGKPAYYASGCIDYGKKVGKYTYKKVVDFDDGKMVKYCENYEHLIDKEIFGKQLEFNPKGTITVKKKDASGKIMKDKKGKPITKETQGQVLTGYFKNLTKYSDGREESPVSIAFMKRPGSPGKHYMEGFEKSVEGKTRCKKSISYDRFKNKPVEYEENTQFGVGKWDKYFKFECGNWYMIPPES